MIPLPESATFSTELTAFDAIARFPLTLPAEVGENMTLKLILCPAFSVAGKVRPFVLNPEPVAVAAEIVTAAPPELVRVSVSEALLPLVTLPKLKLAGVAVSWPEPMPMPETGNVIV